MIKARTILLALSLSQLSACASWRVTSASPQQVMAEYRPSQIRVTRTDSTRLVLRHPRITGDTLYGANESRSARAEHATPYAVALADVGQVAIRKGDAGRTTLLALGSAALATGIGFAIWVASLPSD
jgi:hypothetical protein